MGKHCDLSHVSFPASLAELQGDDPDAPPGQTVMALDTEVTPNKKSHLLRPGNILTLRIAGANCADHNATENTITGQWHDDQDRMFRDGVVIRTL
jgi:hypothetical protein